MTDRASGEFDAGSGRRRRVRRAAYGRRDFVPWGLLPLLGLVALLLFALIWFARHQVQEVAETRKQALARLREDGA